MSYLTTVVGFSIIIRYVYILYLYIYVYIESSDLKHWKEILETCWECLKREIGLKLFQRIALPPLSLLPETFTSDKDDENGQRRAGWQCWSKVKTSGSDENLPNPHLHFHKKSRKAVDTFHTGVGGWTLFHSFFLIPKKLFGMMKKAQQVRIYPPEAIT